MKDEIDFFHSNDGLALYFKATIAESSTASIVFVHGVGEHIGRYQESFQFFSEQGYSCFGFDQRGFGRSEGERGHINAFSDYVEDLAKFIDEIVRQKSTKPIFLLAHSMGSIVALAYALKYADKIQGLLIFSCPVKLSSCFADLAGVIAQRCAVFMPKLKLPSLINPQALSDNSENIQAFITDPYAVSKVSVNWLAEFKLARADILSHAQDIELPVLINHGDADSIAALAGAKTLFATWGTDDKTLHIYPDLKHELLNHSPAKRAEVLEQTFAWLKQHTPFEIAKV